MLAPQGSKAPEASFSVAIRTVTIDGWEGTASYGVGGGITFDSRIDQEYAETRTKARVLVRRAAQFTLLETMKWEPIAGYWLLDQHLERLEDSARYCGFNFNREGVEAQLIDAVPTFGDRPQKVRLSLDQQGRVAVSVEELVECCGPVRVVVDDVPVDPSDWRLYHKTSMRSRYEQTRRRHPEADDVLMINNRGEVMESTIANVIVRLGNTWLTPPLSSGCLPGVMRRVLLERGEIVETPVPIADMERAHEVQLINSVRGRIPVTLLDTVEARNSGRRTD
jgi:para-aminobenzoate synthetase/4-amino-4-deoxychorismate lyase